MILNRFADRPAASAALAAQVLLALSEGIDRRGRASMALPGGSTPVAFFEALREAALDWSRVGITLTDERWVPESDAASNGALVRGSFRQGAAAAATFVPLYDGSAEAATATRGGWARLQALPLPFDAVVLGMGEDGHFASLFPGNAELRAALDSRAAPGLIAMRAPVHPTARISLNLAALLDTQRLFLLITGQTKLDLLLRAAREHDAQALPVSALLAQPQPLVEVFWSP